MPTASRSRKVGGETCRLGAAVRKKSSPVAQPREISHIIIHNALYTGIYVIILYETWRTIFSWRIYKCDRKCRGKSVLFFVCSDVYSRAMDYIYSSITKQSLLFFRLLQYACGFYSYFYYYNTILIIIIIIICMGCVTKKSNQSFVTQKNRVNKNGDNGEQ